MRAKEFTPKDIHKLADSKGVKWDNEPSFLKLTKQLTGKEHLDDLDQEDLKKVKQHLEKIKESVANSRTLEERKKKPDLGENFNSLSEGLASMLVNKIFFARSNKTPKGWSYDHVGFITQDGKQIQMSGHKGNDVYITNAVTDDPEFLKQNIKIVSLPKPVSVPTTNTVGAENCGTFVANVLQANGVKGVDTQKIYSVFKKPPEQNLPENFADGNMWVDQYDQIPDTWIMKEVDESIMSFLAKPVVKAVAKKPTTSLADIRAASQTQDLIPPPHIQMYLSRIRDAKQKGIAPQFSASEYSELEQWVARQKAQGALPENFADGKHPEDKGDSARHGIPKHASISSLRKIAKQGGRKGQLAHWQANMRSGHNK